MPLNIAALIRYTTIDACLRNRAQRWTLPDLMEACGKALQKEGGAVSRRAIQMDLEHLRANNAPIVVEDKKYYTYKNPEYSITSAHLTAFDVDQIRQMAVLLNCYKDHIHFPEASQWVKMLEDKANGLATTVVANPVSPAFTIDTTPEGPVSDIEFYADQEYAQILLQHPIHPTQQLLNVRIDRLHHFTFKAVIDQNLERMLLSHGEHIEVLQPKPLRLRLGSRIWKAGRHY